MKWELILSGTTPCVSTLCLPDVTAHDRIFQAFPLHIYILQVMKYWRWEWPGNEANTTLILKLAGGVIMKSLGSVCW